MHLEKSFLNGHFFLNFAHFAKREMHLVQRRGDRVGEDEREDFVGKYRRGRRNSDS